MNILDIVDKILKKTGYEEMLMTSGDQERLDNIAELKNAILLFENEAGEKIEVNEYLDKIALFSSTDKEENKKSVKFMTIHASKGLEFPIVFVLGLNEGTFPSSRVRTKDELEEERRLAYVAFTRAEKLLFLTDSEGYNYLTGTTRYPSRFLFNISPDLFDRDGVMEDEFISQALKEIQINENLLDKKYSVVIDKKIGDEVIHPVFGNGIILEVNNTENEYVVKFDNIETKRNIKKDFEGLQLKHNFLKDVNLCLNCNNELLPEDFICTCGYEFSIMNKKSSDFFSVNIIYMTTTKIHHDGVPNKVKIMYVGNNNTSYFEYLCPEHETQLAHTAIQEFFKKINLPIPNTCEEVLQLFKIKKIPMPKKIFVTKNKFVIDREYQ